MSAPSSTDRNASSGKRGGIVLAVVTLAFAAFLAFVWIPLDVETGVFFEKRRKLKIGDSFAPMLAAGLFAFGGLVLLFESLFTNVARTRLSTGNIFFCLGLFALFALFMTLTMWTGPLAVSLFGDDDSTYVYLRATAPWKYLGFVTGGTLLVATIICLAEKRLSLKALLIGVAAVLVMIAVYDLPFDDLLLPPNGDFN